MISIVNFAISMQYFKGVFVDNKQNDLVINTCDSREYHDRDQFTGPKHSLNS